MDQPMDALRLVLVVAVAGMAISTLEFWMVASSFGDTGSYSWRLQQLRQGVPRRLRLSRLPGAMFGESGVRALLALRIVLLAAVIMAPFGSWAFFIFVALLVINNLIFTWRRGGYGDDGSDQMSAIVLITVFLTVGPHSTPLMLEMGLWFIALQACLSYATAGVAKLISPIWRSGNAVYLIFNTSAYGLQAVAEFLQHRRWLNLTLCWAVILMETLFPLALVLPEPWNWIFLVWGTAFHLLNAIIMGLNSFLWAFVATYPAILFASWHLHETLDARGIW